MAIHERLKEVRVKSGMTQAEFGAAVGVSTNTQMRYEKGHRHPDTEYLRAVANQFNVDFIWLINGDSNFSKMTDSEIHSQADDIRSSFSRMFGMKPDDLDFLLQWLQLHGSSARLSPKEQAILNSYRATDHYGKRAMEAVSDVVPKGDIQNGVVPANAWGATEFINALQGAFTKAKM